jgi:hypothetical protein
MVDGTESFIADTRVQVGRLGAIAAGACGAGSILLAYRVYHVPVIAQMMGILSATLFWRYRNNFFDQALRAVGRVRSSMWLATAKAAASFALFLPLVSVWRLWGAVFALAILSICSGVAYQSVFERSEVRTLAGLGVGE